MRKSYLLWILTSILTFNYIDRIALGVVLDGIKQTFSVSDTELGFLSGLAFATFYSLMGVPIARWADRGDRIKIIAITTLLWSIGVAACGLAQTFLQLLLIRVAVGVGEAGCVPPSYSIIADTFARSERPRAVAIYGLGGGLACVVGYFLSGQFSETFGWRETFLLLSLPGPFLAAIAWLTLKDSRHALPTADNSVSMLEVAKILWANKTFRHLLICFSLSQMFSYGLMQWQAVYLIRHFNLSSGEVGVGLALAYGVAIICGTYLGGELAARFAPNDESRQLKWVALTLSAGGLFSVLIYCASSALGALLWMALATTLVSVLNGPLFSTIQSLVPDRIRAVSFSILYLVSNFVGLGMGPLLAGVLSDAFEPWAGSESLRFASMGLAPGFLWAAWHAWCARATVASDLVS